MSQTLDSNRILTLFARKKSNILSVYSTAGFPQINDTITVLETLQSCGVDMIEIGMPFSDPIADGPTIQESSTRALENGMTTALLFQQLKDVRKTVSVPLILMGYVNPVIQFGIENFCAECSRVGIDGVILPDLPLYMYEQEWKPLFMKYGLHNIMLITPQTPKERVELINAASGGFVYAVSSQGTTGGALTLDDTRTAYFQRLKEYRNEGVLTLPVMIGFGIHDKTSFDAACRYAEGAIIGSAFIKAIADNSRPLQENIHSFVEQLQ